jgi:hypothetical protein
LTDLDQLSPYPVVEAAVVLHDNARADLDFTLDRGRIDLTNRKDKGEATARVRFRNQSWELILPEPGDQLALELYGRWPSGVHFTRKRTEEAPTSDLVVLVLKGRADVNTGTRRFALGAPPGPALYHWDSVVGADPVPQRLVKLPDWANPGASASERAKKIQPALDRLRRQLAKGAPDQVLKEALASQDPIDRRIAVFGLAALDDLASLVDILADRSQSREVREAAIRALRHYMGRDPRHDQELFSLLTEKKNLSPAHAEIIVDLLHSPGEADQARPETYEALIEYLKHDRQAVRELAYWHLIRLVPAGRDIKYNPAGSPEEREAGYKEWKKLVPSGKLPPKGK